MTVQSSLQVKDVSLQGEDTIWDSKEATCLLSQSTMGIKNIVNIQFLFPFFLYGTLLDTEIWSFVLGLVLFRSRR